MNTKEKIQTLIIHAAPSSVDHSCRDGCYTSDVWMVAARPNSHALVASVVEWSVCSTAVREGTGSIPAGDNVVIPVFPPKATCPLSSDQNLAL